MSRRISTKKYGKKTRKSRKSRKTRKSKKNKKVYLDKKQFGSGLSGGTPPPPVLPSSVNTNIYLNLECQEVIKQISSLDKNAINSLNWQELNNNLTINVTDEVHLENAECTLCSMVTDENQRNYCKLFYNKCKLLYLYRRFIGEYNNELVDVDVLRTIMKNTIPHNDVVGIQNFLIQLGANFTEIRHIAFSRRYLKSVTIPNSVQRIDDSAFSDNQLRNVTIPNSVQRIGSWAFSNNELTSVTIPNSVTEIGAAAFYDNLLTSVTIPNSVTEIASWAFHTNKLTSVTIPNSVTEIGGSAFRGNLLTSVTIPNSVTEIHRDAFRNNLLTSVTIPNSVTIIHDGAFHSNLLTSVTIPNSVTEIGIEAFQNNKLTSVTLPSRYKDTNMLSMVFSNEMDIKFTYTDT